MKRKIYLALCIFGAFIAGAAAMNLFYLHIRPAHRDVMRVMFHMDQEFRASGATRDQNLYQGLVHRWNVVDSHPQGEINIFNDGAYKGEDSDFWFPFRIYILGKIGKGTSPRGQLITKGMDYGKLAFSLESIGASKEAEKFWIIAHKIINRKTMKETKEFVIKINGLEDTDNYKEVEEIMLKK